MTTNHTPHHPKSPPASTVGRARRFITSLPDRLAPNNARSLIGYSFALVLADLALAFAVRLPASLLPTVASLTVVLVTASPPALALVPKRLREMRRGLCMAAIILLLVAVALTIGTTVQATRQGERAAARCLAAAKHVATETGRPQRPVQSSNSLRSALAILGVALCGDIPAGRS